MMPSVNDLRARKHSVRRETFPLAQCHCIYKFCFILTNLFLVRFICKKRENINWDVSPIFSPVASI